MYLLGPLLICAVSSAEAQVSPALEVPLETTSGWGRVEASAGYRALRIQGRSSADPLVLARLFGDFTTHPVIFSRVVQGVDILACDRSSLKARYRTAFDPKPGGKTLVDGTETLIDYVSAVRPKNAVKGVMVGSQSAVLAADARYVIDRLIALAEEHKSDVITPLATANFFNCRA